MGARRSENYRIQQGKFLTESDILRYGSASIEILNDIIDSCGPLYRKHGKAQVVKKFFENNRLVSKWKLNLLAALMLNGGG